MHHFLDQGSKLVYTELKKLYDEMEFAAAIKNAKPAAPITKPDRIRAWLNNDRDYLNDVDLLEKSIDGNEKRCLLSMFRINNQ